MAKDKDGNEIIEESVVLDDAAVKTIVDKTKDAVVEAVGAEVDTKVAAAVKEAVESGSKEILDKYLEKTEEIEKKAIEKHKAEQIKDDPVAQGIEAKDFTQEIADMSPAMRFFRAIRAMDPDAGNAAELKALNKFALASQIAKRAEIAKEKGYDAVQKTGYANETTAADGAVLIPDAEFVTTVFDNLPSYGVAFRFADVRQTDRTSVRVLTLDSGLTFYSTAEAGVKTGAKLAFAKTEVSLQKYAVIVPSTDELSDDAAIDYWQLVTRELTRAYAKKCDELVFTDTTYGVTNQSGVLTYSVGTATVVTWDDLLNAQAKTEDDLDESNYKWFMRKQTWLALVQARADSVTAADGKGPYLIGSLGQGTGWRADVKVPTTPWGTEVVFTRVLPTSQATSTNDAFAVYGDLKNTLVYNKRGMALKMLTEATVVDSEGSNLNLATQDASAMRAVIRMLHILPKGNKTKFVIVGRGTVS